MGMRLAAQAKCGFYPVNPKTIDFICKAIRVADPLSSPILDPCCGEGRALAQFGQLLGVPNENLYGCELDTRRAAAASEHANILHCSFFGARIVPVNSFSLAWLNPPYEDEIKQGATDSHKSRQLEIGFLIHATRLVVPNGIVIMHCPHDRITDAMKSAFRSICHKPTIVLLPKDCSPYREALLIGTKKVKEEVVRYYDDMPEVSVMPELVMPVGDKVRRFFQVEPTDEQILDSISRAPYLGTFTKTKTKAKLRPVMPLGPGHLGLTLASGMLDGLLEPEGYEPHVVRGIAYKESEIANHEKTINEDNGKVTETKTYRENIKLKIRVLTADGTISEKM